MLGADSTLSLNASKQPGASGIKRAASTMSVIVVPEQDHEEKNAQAEAQVKYWRRLSVIFRLALIATIGIVVVIAGKQIVFFCVFFMFSSRTAFRIGYESWRTWSHSSFRSPCIISFQLRAT